MASQSQIDIAIVVPTDFESRAVRKQASGLAPVADFPYRAWRWSDNGRALVLAIGGVGDATAGCAEAVIGNFAPKRLILAGFAGALLPQQKLGDRIVIREGEHPSKRLYASPVVLENAAMKLAKAEETGAEAVEMEYDQVCAVAQKLDVPLDVIRVISDRIDDVLHLDLLTASLDFPTGRSKTWGICGYLALRPWRIPAFYRMVAPMTAVQRALQAAITEHLRDLA